MNKGTIFRQWLTTWPIRGILFLCSLSFCMLMACNDKYTENQNSPVVKLRNDLKALAIGDMDEVKGETSSEESYVLLYGYQGPTEDLPVSETLQQKLKSLTPYDYERFVLVHIVNDDIKEYKKWAAGDDPQFTNVPFLIRGRPFRIAVERLDRYAVANKLENQVLSIVNMTNDGSHTYAQAKKANEGETNDIRNGFDQLIIEFHQAVLSDGDLATFPGRFQDLGRLRAVFPISKLKEIARIATKASGAATRAIEIAERLEEGGCLELLKDKEHDAAVKARDQALDQYIGHNQFLQPLL